MNRLSPLLFSLPLFAACSHNVYSPPARPMAFASPDTVESGETAVRGSGSVNSEVFGPSIYAGSGGLRHGLSDRLEVVGDLSYAQVVEKSAAGTHRGIGMARAGVKYLPFDAPHLALTSGFGGGYAPAAGPYTSLDAGGIIGYENPYVVPYLQAGIFGSLPLNAREVDVTGTDDEETQVDTPDKTFGFSFGAGLKVPIQTAALFVGLSSTLLYDKNSDDGFMSLGGGVETVF